MSTRTETPKRPRAPLWARLLPIPLAWKLAKALPAGPDSSLRASGQPEAPASLSRQARRVEIAGRAWLRLGDRFDPRWICRRGEILGLEHRSRAQAEGLDVIYGVIPPGRQALASSLLDLFDPPVDTRPTTAPTARIATASPDLLARVEGVAVLPTLVWVEPTAEPRVRIGPPLVPSTRTGASRGTGAELTAWVFPFAEVLAEHPSAWPWHRLGPPPSLAPRP